MFRILFWLHNIVLSVLWFSFGMGMGGRMDQSKKRLNENKLERKEKGVIGNGTKRWGINKKWKESLGSNRRDLGFVEMEWGVVWSFLESLVLGGVCERSDEMIWHPSCELRTGRGRGGGGTRTRRRCASRPERATCRCWRRGIVGRSPGASECRSGAGRLQTREASGSASSCWSSLEPGRPGSPAGRGRRV